MCARAEEHGVSREFKCVAGILLNTGWFPCLSLLYSPFIVDPLSVLDDLSASISLS